MIHIGVSQGLKLLDFECYRIGDLLLNAGTREVSRNGVLVPIPRLSLKLLLSLVRHAPNVVSTQQLEDEVWSGLVVDKGTVNKRALLLRKSLGENQGKGPYITIVRGTGYRMLVDVERMDHCPEQLDGEEPDQQHWYQRISRPVRITLYWVLGLLALLIVYEILRSQLGDRFSGGDTGEAASLAVQTQEAHDRRSVAVLPFIDVSDGNLHQYLGDGIAEEVINLITGMDGLQVAARTSSFAMHDSAMSISEIAERLKVGTILQGSVRHDDEQLRVTVQLVDTQSGYHIWSQTYQRDYSEVFEVQDDIAIHIAEALKLTLDEAERPDSRKTTSGNVEAFSLYLKGRKLLNDRIHLRAAGLYDALGFFEQAAAEDPGFVRAHAGKAAVYWLLTSYDESLDRDTYFELAENSANYALELEPSATDALSVLASVFAERGELERAVALFRKIEEIGSTDPNIVHWQASVHFRLGYFEDLIGGLAEAYRLDPLNQHVGWSLATALNFAGKPREAADILKDLSGFAYRDYLLGLAHVNAGDFTAARTLLRDARLRSGALPAVFADRLIDALEDPGLAAVTAKDIVTATETGMLDRLVGFEALLLLGSPRAFDLDIDPLTDVVKTQILAQVWNNWGSTLRRDKRFKAWVRRLGYEEFWRKNSWPDRCRPTSLTDFECI